MSKGREAIFWPRAELRPTGTRRIVDPEQSRLLLNLNGSLCGPQTPLFQGSMVSPD